MVSNGDVVLHMQNGQVHLENASRAPQSAPLYVIPPDEDLQSSGAVACVIDEQPQSQVPVGASLGSGEALDAQQLRNVVEKNRVATLKDSRHPFAHLTRRFLNGKSVCGARVSHSPQLAEIRRSGTVKRQALLLAVRKDKKVIIVPVILLCLCMGLGLWGVFAASSQERRQRLRNAQNRAADKAQTIASELRASYLPVKVMQSFVTRYPHFPTLNATFESLASELLSLTAAGSIANMQLAPLAVVSAIYPIAGNQAAVGHDLLDDPNNRDMALRTIKAHNLTLAGPYKLVQGFVGAPARYPIFVSGVDFNETFGMAHDVTNCSDCYDARTRTKFWGFATVLIHWERFINQTVRIGDLAKQGLRHRLTRADDVDRSHVLYLAGSQEALSDPVEVFIPVPNNVWCLAVVDARGWSPNWEWPLVAMVIVMSLVLAVLVGLALVGRAQQHLLLHEVLSANQQLEDAATVLLQEKERVEALLRRQFDLIECLGVDPDGGGGGAGRGGGAGGAAGEPGGGGGGANGGGISSDRLSLEGHPSNPAEQIEEMRKKLLNTIRLSNPGKVSGNGSAAGAGGGGGGANGRTTSGKGSGSGADLGHGDQIVLGKMIGEGTFGKVYRGLWRGSEVAIKTMILPANMSGKEKREKMAIMEAAISSSLAHPNVVATYTYQIKPIKDSSSQKTGRHSEDLTASAIIVGNDKAADVGDSCGTHDSSAGFKDDLEEDAQNRAGIHSYEVQLVLEYCDKGCLREALDAGIFFGRTGLNFAAILDTAADVAKALLHLHLNDVLHGDLKADNVMLKSCGGEGRGIVAKVADFGLAIKMDHQKTHVSATFQGTLTHMAPEVLLRGQVSKAADVFAFGITLWEMFTSGYPYPGVPGALLGHLISKEGKRPSFPLGTPSGFKELAERCWHREAAMRPSFDEILDTLTTLRAEQPTPTPALPYIAPTPEQRREQKLREREGSAAAVRARLAEESARQSASAPLPRLHHHYPGRKGSGSGAPPGNQQPPRPPHRTPVVSGDGANPRASIHSPRCGGGGGTRRSSRSRAKADDAVIVVGGRNVSLSSAIISKSVVLEPICETRYEGDPDAPAPDGGLL